MYLKPDLEFIHITKTGGTSIINLFDIKKANHKLPKQRKPNKNVYRFCFIRNPIDRFISAFEYQKKCRLTV